MRYKNFAWPILDYSTPSNSWLSALFARLNYSNFIFHKFWTRQPISSIIKHYLQMCWKVLPTRLKHSTIHKGTNTISQDQVTSSSSFNGRKTNCSALTARNSSNSNERSCLTDQTQAPTLAILPNISGTNTITHNGRFELSLSHAKSSNINRIRWSLKSEIHCILSFRWNLSNRLPNLFVVTYFHINDTFIREWIKNLILLRKEKLPGPPIMALYLS